MLGRSYSKDTIYIMTSQQDTKECHGNITKNSLSHGTYTSYKQNLRSKPSSIEIIISLNSPALPCLKHS